MTGRRLFAVSLAAALFLCLFLSLTSQTAASPSSDHVRDASGSESISALPLTPVVIPTTTTTTTSPPPSSVPTTSPTTTPVPTTTTTQPPLPVSTPTTATTAPITPTPTTSPAPSSDATSTDTADWACIREGESGDRYNDPTAPSGAYGILESTAAAEGLPWPVSDASPAQQDAAALDLYAKYGWQPWSTAAGCGL